MSHVGHIDTSHMGAATPEYPTNLCLGQRLDDYGNRERLLTLGVDGSGCVRVYETQVEYPTTNTSRAKHPY